MRKREHTMADNRTNGRFGLVLGGVVVLAAAVFILTGGELGGKKEVKSDADLPPVTTGAPTKK
jgi:hypothetical protein